MCCSLAFCSAHRFYESPIAKEERYMQFIKNVIKSAIPSGFTRSDKYEKYEREILDFHRQFIAPGDLCFDVGAHEGGRVGVFLKLDATVIAIEPQDECVRIIKESFGDNSHLTIIQKVLGAAEGEAELMSCEARTISSLSPEWVKAVRESGRFSNYNWDKKQIVQMTTLDKLIERYGVPAFIKIDVEGFESEVIKGLSRPVKALSLEFTQEYIESTFKCFNHLNQLSDIRLNLALGESLKLALDNWVTCEEMVQILLSYADTKTYGDIYIKF